MLLFVTYIIVSQESKFGEGLGYVTSDYVIFIGSGNHKQVHSSTVYEVERALINKQQNKPEAGYPE
jgi:hypothetical protein